MNLRNQEGFTLLESLLALFVNSLIVLLIGSLLHSAQNMKDSLQHEKNIEWHIFLNQAEHDILNKKIKSRTPKIITLSEDGTKTTYTYMLKATELRRQKDNTGYVPMLTEVRDLNFQDAIGGIKIQSVFKNEKEMEAYLPIEIYTEKELEFIE